MSVPSLIESFHLHLRARGLRPLTQERYVYGAQRLHRHAGKPAEAVTGADGYAFLVHIGGTILLRYLGRYINRVAISPGRIHAYDGTTVTFDGKGERFTVPTDTFIQRFAQHVLPPGFVRIRFCGLWATRHRGAKLAAARDWLAAHGRRQLVPETSATGPTMATRSTQVLATRPLQATPGDPCPHCGHGVYQRQPGGHRPRRAERQRLLRLMLAHRTTTPGSATTPA